MSGLANLIPYFECQYPQVVPFTNAQAAAVVNSQGSTGVSGMGDYLSNFNWPIPQYLQPGNKRALIGMGDFIHPFAWPIPQYLKPGNMRALAGLGCPDCGGGCRGLGQGTITVGGISIPLSSPGGYFASGMDWSTWGLEEWGTVGVGVYLLLSLWGDTKRQVRKSKAAAKAYRKAS